MTLDEATLELRGTETRIERVPIAVNLRHNGFRPIWAMDSTTAQVELDERRANEGLGFVLYFLKVGCVIGGAIGLAGLILWAGFRKKPPA